MLPPKIHMNKAKISHDSQSLQTKVNCFPSYFQCHARFYAKLNEQNAFHLYHKTPCVYGEKQAKRG